MFWHVSITKRFMGFIQNLNQINKNSFMNKFLKFTKKYKLIVQ